MQTIPFPSKLATLKISVGNLCVELHIIQSSHASQWRKNLNLIQLLVKVLELLRLFSALMYESSSNSSAALSQRKIGSTQSIRVLPLLTNLGAYSVLPTLYFFHSKLLLSSCQQSQLATLPGTNWPCKKARKTQ